MNCLFKIEHKETGQVENVYAFRDASISDEFLIWYIDRFKWVNCFEFKPYEQEDIKKIKNKE